MLEIVGLPIMPANLRAVVAAIEAVAVTMNMTIPEAHHWLAEKVTQAKKAGHVINNFWFQDAKYNAAASGKASALPVERETRAETQARLAREKGLVH